METLTLLSVGGPTSTTVSDDAAYIQKRYLDDLISQGKEVVVVMHSYGGIPGTESVKGRTCRDMAAQAKKGGVVALIYMAAFLISAGQSVDSSLPDGAASIMTFEVGWAGGSIDWTITHISASIGREVVLHRSDSQVL